MKLGLGTDIVEIARIEQSLARSPALLTRVLTAQEQAIYQQLASQHPAQPRQQVVIVGSGPSGMVTALELARHGVASVVLYVDGVKRAATYDPAQGTLTPDDPVAEGQHQLTYAYIDAAGNEGSQSAALQITIDTTAPNAPPR